MKHEFLSMFFAFLMLMTLFSPFFHAMEIKDSQKAPFVAYRAKTIPNIDGVLSPGEWNDTKPYSQVWENGGPDITNGPLGIAFCLKYDLQNLYLLFTVNDNETDNRDSLDISIMFDYGDSMSYYHVLVLYPNGTGYEAWLTLSGIMVYPDQKIEGKTSSTYSNGMYTFEASLNLTRYFSNNTGFGIGYSDGNLLDTQSVLFVEGVDYDSKLPIVFSSESYSGSDNIYNLIEGMYDYKKPLPPMSLVATFSNLTLNLSWLPPPDANSPVTEYKIYRGTSPNSEEYLASVNGSVTYYIDSNITEGTIYYYRISAVNGLGESNLSEEVSIQIPEIPSSAWPQSTLMLAMTITVLVSAGILVAIFRRIRRKN